MRHTRQAMYSLFFGLIGLVFAATAACDSGSVRRGSGDSCTTAAECESGICGGSVCLDPSGDDDFDGLTNSVEVAFGSNPVSPDTDEDGIGDREEFGNGLQPIDTDGDGRPDIIESAITDADGDCITDQFDARDDVPDTDISPMIAFVCRVKGICAGPEAGLGAACDENGKARCIYDGVAGWEAVETVCDGRDENCDGRADEGLCPAAMEALVLPASVAIAVGGVATVEAQARVGGGALVALDGAAVVWARADSGTAGFEMVVDGAATGRVTLAANAPGVAEVTAMLGVFVASLEVTVLAATCTDAVRNGDEQGVDCGGSCSLCPEHPCALGVCGASGRCEADGEGFACICDAGFEAAEAAGCVDIDECSVPLTSCGDTAQCVNREGSFDCFCNEGFEDNGAGGCVDVDECAAPVSACGAGSQCVNREGSFDCICNEGFEDNGAGGCVDVDECAAPASPCGPASQCMNSEGSFDCICDTGFEPSGAGGCVDVDECAAPVSACGAGSQCVNREGGFDCICNEGFEDNGAGGCVALDCWTGNGVGVDPGCSEATPLCDVSAGRVCIECRADVDCVGRSGGVVCDLSRNACVTCVDGPGAVDPGCGAAHPVCDASGERRCVRCLDDQDCAGAAEGQLCDDEGPRCVACFDDSDCPWRPYGDTCAAALGRCLPGPQFITMWDSRIVLGLDEDGQALSPGETPVGQLALPLAATGIYDFLVEWGDGSFDVITKWDDPKARHSYANPGVHEVSIRGVVNGWRFAGGGDRGKLLEVQAWGPLRPGPGGQHFEGALNMLVTATDPLDLQGATSLRRSFRGCEAMVDLPGASSWDTSAVTNLVETFNAARVFNGDIATWDVSAVTSLAGTFDGARAFDGNIGGWDVSAVTSLERTFRDAQSFNQDITGWNTANVTTLSTTFESAFSFNQPIGGWNTSQVRSLVRTFEHAVSFNQPLAGWDTSKVTNMSATFRFAHGFDQPIESWNTGAVTTMYAMFQDALAFNQPLNGWNVANVTEMSFMFHQTRLFNQDLSAWDVSRVTNMAAMFGSARAFNGDIGTWDVRRVTRMVSMFAATVVFNRDITLWQPLAVTDMSRMFESAAVFNQPIGNWNVSSVTNMSDMFRTAVAFNQPLGNWNVSNVQTVARMFNNAVRFNQSLRNWDTRNVTSLREIFHAARAFNGDVSTWNTAKVTTMQQAFKGADQFNADISAWNTSAVVDMSGMFDGATRFNRPIGGWNVANVTTMERMFADATAFSWNLGTWNVGSVLNFNDFLAGAALLTADYDALLNGWAALPAVSSGVTFNAGGSRFSTAGAGARNTLATSRGWVFVDGGPSGQ